MDRMPHRSLFRRKHLKKRRQINRPNRMVLFQFYSEELDVSRKADAQCIGLTKYTRTAAESCWENNILSLSVVWTAYKKL